MTPIEIGPDGSPVVKTVTSVPKEENKPVSLTKEPSQVKAESLIPKGLNQDVKKPEPTEKVIDPTLHNLIGEATIKNKELAAKQASEKARENDSKDLKLSKIRESLRQSGADSMSQDKVYNQICEILGW
jgi:hypothetical protein